MLHAIGFIFVVFVGVCAVATGFIVLAHRFGLFCWSLGYHDTTERTLSGGPKTVEHKDGSTDYYCKRCKRLAYAYKQKGAGK